MNKLQTTQMAQGYALPSAPGREAIWDSGASHSITGDSKVISNSRAAYLDHVTDITGNKTQVKAVGHMGDITDVLLVPGVKQTLLSVGAYLDQNGGVLEFTAAGVHYRQGTKSAESHTVGSRREDGLYRAVRTNNAATACLSKKDVQLQLMRERVHTLHRMFGHVSKARLKTIITRQGVRGVNPCHVELLTWQIAQKGSPETQYNESNQVC